MTDAMAVGSLVLSLVAVTTLSVNYMKLKKNFREEIEKSVNDKLAAFRQDLERVESAFAADIDHIKERHGIEIANLAEKIDALRDEVRTGQTQLVQLLTKLVSDKR